MEWINDPGTARRLIGFNIPLGTKKVGMIKVKSITYDPKGKVFVINNKYFFTVDLVRKLMMDLTLGQLRAD